MITTLFIRTWQILRSEKLIWGLYFIFFGLSEQWTLGVQRLGLERNPWQWIFFLVVFRWLFAVATQTVAVILVQKPVSQHPFRPQLWKAIGQSWVQTAPLVAVGAGLMWPLRHVAFSAATPSAKQVALLLVIAIVSLLAEWTPIITTTEQSSLMQTYKHLFQWITRRPLVIARLLAMVILVGFLTILVSVIATAIPILGTAFFVPAIMAAGYGYTYVLAAEIYRLSRPGGSLVDIQV